MPIVRKFRLAVAALFELARHTQPHPLPQLSRRLWVSVLYVELLFGALRRHWLLSTRGPRGGYRLARSPAAISVLDVVAAIDEPDADSPRPEDAGLCPDDGHAAGRIDSSWLEASRHAMAGWLADVTLHDLIEADRRARLFTAAT